MNRYAIALSAAAVLGTAVASQAAVLVTGGDAGEGITLNAANNVYALNIALGNTPDPVTLQGVSFSGAVPSIAVGAGTFGPYGAAFTGVTPSITGTSANDTAATQIAGDLFFGSGSTAMSNGLPFYSLIASNLTPGASYKLDVIQTVGNASGRTQNVLLNGTVVDTVVLPTASTVGGIAPVFNTSATAIADGSGQITLGFEQAAGDGPVFSAVSVSSVPEPASLGLLGLGGLTLLRRRRTA